MRKVRHRCGHRHRTDPVGSAPRHHNKLIYFRLRRPAAGTCVHRLPFEYISAHFRNSTYYGINVLSEDQRHISVRFSQPELDRFDWYGWQPETAGVPCWTICWPRWNAASHKNCRSRRSCNFHCEVIAPIAMKGGPYSISAATIAVFSSFHRQREVKSRTHVRFRLRP